MFDTAGLSGLPPRFKPPLEEAYQADLADEKIHVFYRTGLLCSLLYLSFGLLDVLAMPAHFAAAWAVRGLVLAATLTAFVSARLSRSRFLRRYTGLTCLVHLLWGLGVEAIILLMNPSDPGWSTYYAGLILVIIGLYTATWLRPLHASLTAWALTLTYVLIGVAGQGMNEGFQLVVLVQNCFFLIAANVVGIVSQLMRERSSRQAFLLKHSLAHDLRLEEQAKRLSEHLSEHDALTGLPNRVRFLRKLGELIEERQAGSAVAVLFIDLDNFKPVNDRYGHAAGDHVLSCVAERVRGTIRASDLAARLGGDEFVVALVLADGQEGVTVDRVGSALAEAIAQPVSYDGQLLHVTASVGAATCPHHGSTAEVLLRAADQDMYASKRRGRMLMA